MYLYRRFWRINGSTDCTSSGIIKKNERKLVYCFYYSSSLNFHWILHHHLYLKMTFFINFRYLFTRTLTNEIYRQIYLETQLNGLHIFIIRYRGGRPVAHCNVNKCLDSLCSDWSHLFAKITIDCRIDFIWTYSLPYIPGRLCGIWARSTTAFTTIITWYITEK